MAHLDVEKRKNGEVSLKALMHWTDRASAHILRRVIVGGWMQRRRRRMSFGIA